MVPDEPVSDPASTPESGPHAPYGDATPTVRRYLLSLAALSTRDWLVMAHAWRRRQGDAELVRADAALGRAIERGGLEQARDAVVGPVVQLAQRVAGAPDEAATASGLDAEDLAEAALAGALALIAEALLTPREREALYAHAEPVVSRASLGR